MIDIHCHLLSGVDDGAANLAEARLAIERMVEQKAEGAVVTPHVSTSTLRRSDAAETLARYLEDAWEGLLEMTAQHFPDFTLHRGTELMLDHPQPLLESGWVRLAGTRFVLVEFPGMTIPPRALEALKKIIEDGYTPVIAHPERYWNAGAACSEIVAWKDAGVRLQINCGSLLGLYGNDPEKRVRRLLEAGAADYAASDYHARGPYPLTAAQERLTEMGLGKQSALLFRTNPARLVAGEDPLPVPALDPALAPDRWRGFRRIWPILRGERPA